MAKHEQTSKKVASVAGKTLRNPKSSKRERSLAGSVLTQAPDKERAQSAFARLTGRQRYRNVTPKPKDGELVAGMLEIGLDTAGNVCMNLPRRHRTGHLKFSPRQATSLAALLLKHAVSSKHF